MTARAPGRNEPCPCGSGRKYKHCCAQADRHLALRDDLAQARYRRGLALEKEGRIAEAIEAYRPAKSGASAAPEALSRLGHLFLMLGRGRDAAEAFRAAAGAAPDNAARRLDLVRALTLDKRDAEAEAELRRVLEADPANGDGHWLLGRILAESGRFTEARAAFEHALAANPTQGAVYYDLVRAASIGEADRPLIERMLVAAKTAEQPQQRIQLHLALGKAFDDLEDYATAMRHFDEADRIKTGLGAFDRAAFAGRVDGLIERFTAEFVAGHARHGSSSELPVLIVGMPRSGTTLVEQILSSHRDIAGVGELQFWPECGRLFERAAETSIRDFQERAARECLAILRALAPDAVRVVDKNPSNFLWAGLARVVYPRAVIIHCRRDPIDTCLSIRSTYFAPRPDFSTDPDDLVFYWRQYSRLMDHWRAVLAAERFIEVDYEALVADPEPVARRLISACGLAWDPACLQPERNDRVVRSASKWQVRQPIHGQAVDRWRRYEPWIGSLRQLVSYGRT